MIISLHNGKTMNVSQKRFEEYSKKEENEEKWLQFRIKQFGFSREELIMHPKREIVFFEGDSIKVVCQFRGKYHGGFYGCGRLDENLFDTPEEAYQFATNLKEA